MQQSEKCLFCKIVRGELPSQKIYEDEKVSAFLDIRPINKGHVLVVPKAHFEDLFSLPDDILEKMALVTRDLAKVIKKVVAADGVNIGMNNGKEAGQIIYHAHIHIMPRFANDGHIHWKGKDAKTKELEEIQKKIKENL